MKKFIFTLLLISCGTVNAGPWHHYGHRPHHHGHSHWVAPLILGGVLGAVIVNQTQPQPQVVQQLPPPPYGYNYIQIYDYNCNCYKWALTPSY